MISHWDIEVATRTVYGEARGEPEIGQRAVAHIIANRLAAGHFGHTLAQVCLEPYQFSCWLVSHGGEANYRSMVNVAENDPVMASIRDFIDDAVGNIDIDPTHGAQYYYAEGTPPPDWAKGFTCTGQIGHHIFYRQDPRG